MLYNRRTHTTPEFFSYADLQATVGIFSQVNVHTVTRGLILGLYIILCL